MKDAIIILHLHVEAIFDIFKLYHELLKGEHGLVDWIGPLDFPNSSQTELHIRFCFVRLQWQTQEVVPVGYSPPKTIKVKCAFGKTKK